MSTTINKLKIVLILALFWVKSDESTEETITDDTPLDYFSPGFFFIYKNKKNCVKNTDGKWELDIASFWVNGYNPATFTGEWDTTTGEVAGNMKLVDVKTVTLLIRDKDWAGIWRGGHLKIDNFTEAVLLSSKFKEDSLHTFNLTSKNMSCPIAFGSKSLQNIKREVDVAGNYNDAMVQFENLDLKMCKVSFDLNDHAQFNVEGVRLLIRGFYADSTPTHNAGEAIAGYYAMALFDSDTETFRNKKYRVNFWQDNFSVDLYYYLHWQTIPWYFSWWMVTIYVLTLLLIIIGVLVCLCSCGKSGDAE